MRSGTQSSKLRLIDSSDHSDDEAVADHYDAFDPEAGRSRRDGAERVSPALVLFTVSLACATAAIAAGSYALWLTRQNAARKTLTDVQDILKVCQERMHQMEDDLNRLPSSLDSATA